jgi:hypothetical protein
MSFVATITTKGILTNVRFSLTNESSKLKALCIFVYYKQTTNTMTKTQVNRLTSYSEYLNWLSDEIKYLTDLQKNSSHSGDCTLAIKILTEELLSKI